jgi:hypothetical protein
MAAREADPHLHLARGRPAFVDVHHLVGTRGGVALAQLHVLERTRHRLASIGNQFIQHALFRIEVEEVRVIVERRMGFVLRSDCRLEHNRSTDSRLRAY